MDDKTKNEYNPREDLMWSHETLSNVSSNQCIIIKKCFQWIIDCFFFLNKSLKFNLSDKLSEIGVQKFTGLWFIQ